MTAIEFFNSHGKLLATVQRSSCKRFSMQASADHKAMDKFKAAHPDASEARIGPAAFGFKDGRSFSQMRFED